MSWEKNLVDFYSPSQEGIAFMVPLPLSLHLRKKVRILKAVQSVQAVLVCSVDLDSRIIKLTAQFYFPFVLFFSRVPAV